MPLRYWGGGVQGAQCAAGGIGFKALPDFAGDRSLDFSVPKEPAAIFMASACQIPLTLSPRSMNRGHAMTSGQVAQVGLRGWHHPLPMSQTGLSISPGRSG